MEVVSEKLEVHVKMPRNLMQVIHYKFCHACFDIQASIISRNERRKKPFKAEILHHETYERRNWYNDRRKQIREQTYLDIILK